MLMRVIIRRLQCSAIVSSQFVKSFPKINSFSNVKNLKSEQHVALRTYVSAVPEVNKSSEPEQDDQKLEFYQYGLYYSNYISTDPRFSELFFRKELISENAHNSSLLFTLLKELSSKSEIVTQDLEGLLPHLRTELQNLSLYELLEAVDLTFRLYEKKDEEMWELIRSRFDKEFLSRRKSLSYNEMFMIFNVLNSFGVITKFDFVHKAMFKFAFKVGKLSHTEFVYYCYYLKKIQNAKLEKFQYEFMNLINERVPSLNQTEMGLLADAFTAIDVTFSRSLFQTFMTKVINEIESMDTVVIKSISKQLGRISYMDKDNLQLLINFQEKLVPMVSKFNIYQLRGLVFSGTRIRYLNMDLYDEVIKRVKSDMTKFSLMDIEGFVFLNSAFNIDDKEFLDMAVNEFERRDDCLQQHITYTKFLGDLIHFQIYPKNLLEKALSNEIFTRVMKSKTGRQAWASLKWSLEVEKPEFKFSELDEKLYTKLLKIMKYIKLSHQNRCYYQTRLNWMLENIYGKDSVCSKRITFQHKNCCLMRFDKNLKAQEIPKEFRESGNDFKMRPPCDDHIWVSIFPLLRDCYADFDEKIINYKTKTHLRQLSILGYKHIYITIDEWYPHMNKTPTSLAFMEGFMNRKLQELTGKEQQAESEN